MLSVETFWTHFRCSHKYFILFLQFNDCQESKWGPTYENSQMQLNYWNLVQTINNEYSGKNLINLISLISKISFLSYILKL